MRNLGMAFDAPVIGSVDPWAMLLALAAAIVLFPLKRGVIPTLGICSAASVTLHFALGVI